MSQLWEEFLQVEGFKWSLEQKGGMTPEQIEAKADEYRRQIVEKRNGG